MDNYEQKYNEILEWARKNKARLNGVPIEEVIPELRESEDERIRKEIISALKFANDGGVYDKHIAYLEKQKEQKPNIELCPHSIKSKSYKENGYPIENCDYGLEIAQDILEKTLSKVEGYQSDDGIREHQTAIQAVKDAMKEQKPVDLSDMMVHKEPYIAPVPTPMIADEQKHTLKFKVGDKVHLEGDEINILTITGIEEDRYLTDCAYGPILFGAEDIWERVEQKSAERNNATINGEPIPTENQSVDIPLAEWSEEDEKTISDACCWLAEYAGYLMDNNYGKASMLMGLTEKLKSLHPQPKAELTLLDENIINAAVAFVEQNNHFNYWGGIDKRTVIKALLSLKPHWKPSEEQMKAMSYFVRKHQATANRATTKWPEFEAFKSLYNDLKKLL